MSHQIILDSLLWINGENSIGTLERKAVHWPQQQWSDFFSYWAFQLQRDVLRTGNVHVPGHAMPSTKGFRPSFCIGNDCRRFRVSSWLKLKGSFAQRNVPALDFVISLFWVSPGCFIGHVPHDGLILTCTITLKGVPSSSSSPSRPFDLPLSHLNIISDHGSIQSSYSFK